MKTKYKTVSEIAFKDISKYLDEHYNRKISSEQYLITPQHLQTKETRKLNRELGIHKINKLNNIENTKR